MIKKFTQYSFCLFLCLFSINLAKAQQFAEFNANITEDGKPLAGASIEMILNDISMQTEVTNSDGNAFFATLTPGEYTIKITKNEYNDYSLTGYRLNPGLNEILNQSLVKVGEKMKIVVINAKSKKAAIDIVNNVTSVTGSDLIKGAGRGVDGLTRKNAAINTSSGGTSVRGSRTDANGTFIDGMRTIGGGAVPSLGIDALAVNVGGIPAQFGDLTGGAFNYTTKSSSLKTQILVEGITSTLLDPYGYNNLEGFISGPIWKKKYADSLGKTKSYVKLGYTLNGNIGYLKDPNPTRTGVYRVKESVLNDLEQNPLKTTPLGFVHNANYLRSDDIELLKARPNSPQYSGNFIGKLDYHPTRNIDLVGYGSYFYNAGLIATNSIMNFKNNGRFDNSIIRSYLMFTQRFKVDKESTLKSAFYTVRAEYQRVNNSSRDARHLDNIFDYGYIGKFNTYKAPRYAYDNYDQNQNPNRVPRVVKDQFGNMVSLTNAWYQEGFTDTLTTFNAASTNPIRAKYTENVYSFFEGFGGKVRSQDQIQLSQGLLNGFSPQNVYSIWGTPGGVTSAFNKNQTDIYSLFALGQLKVQGKTENGRQKFPHDIQMGLFYEQRVVRGYSLSANDLWVLMGQRANTHIAELDKSKAFLNYDENGVFGDTVRYERLVDKNKQSTFDRNLRQSLINSNQRNVDGNLYDEKTFIDVNSLDPNNLKLNFFNADELLNNGTGGNGNGYVSYFGYDHLGKKVNGKPSIESFLNDPNKRTIGAFQPVYIAAWIQDQIQFKDLTFRGGLRMERYDANQFVLQDPYSLYPIKTVGEVSQINGVGVSHPDNIGDDYKVYVNNIKNPTKILGYRDGDKWYNSDGSEQRNPDFIANQTNTGKIAPYLVDPTQENITARTFKDFEPILNILPRLWFSFPLGNKNKTFYLSYDVLAQRPNQNASFLSIDEIYFLKNRQGRTISNGSLQARVKTDYEMGFKQIFGKKSNYGIELAASYSEIRKDFGLYQISNGYPVTYTTYRNIDFSTVTGFRAGLVADDIGAFDFSLSYMLQYADGTGSNINSQAALIQNGQPNLRNIIPLGELDVRNTLKAGFGIDFEGGRDNAGKPLYKGPIKYKKWLEYASINVIGNNYSGLPYTPTTNAVQIGAVQRAQIKGLPFGARMPSQNTIDINISKGFLLTRKAGKNPVVATAFIWIENILNTKNIVNVFPFTGAALDDGFLNSQEGQLAVQRSIDAQSYVDLYRTFLNSNTGNFGRPRTIRFGMRFGFN